MDIQRIKMRELRSRETYKEMVSVLQTHAEFLLVRPTGFGKTYLLAKLAKKYKRVLYLAPLLVIIEEIKEKYPDMNSGNVEFMTYNKFAKNSQTAGWENHYINNYDIIMLDEAHRLGGTKTCEALKIFNEYNRKLPVGRRVKMVGTTATPKRSDLKDITELFSYNVSSTYTLQDAFEEGIALQPIYFYTVQETNNDLVALQEKLQKHLPSQRPDLIPNYNKIMETLQQAFKKLSLKYANLINANEVLKSSLEEYAPDADYLKVLCFYPNYEILKGHVSTLTEWFKYAKPNLKIRTHIIATATQTRATDVLGITPEKNTIDLIVCIDMLNMGVHIEGLTDILFLRHTNSDIVYDQQYGRGISVDAEVPTRVFDFVANLTTKPFSMRMRQALDEDNFNFIEYTLEQLDQIVAKADTRISLMLLEYHRNLRDLWRRTNSDLLEDIIHVYKEDGNIPIKYIATLYNYRLETLVSQLYKKGVSLEGDPSCKFLLSQLKDGEALKI